MLDQRGDVGDVADDQRAHGCPLHCVQLFAQRGTDGFLDPADGGGEADHAVGAADHAGDGYAGADVAGAFGYVGSHLVDEGGEGLDCVDDLHAAWAVGFAAVQDAAAQADAGRP